MNPPCNDPLVEVLGIKNIQIETFSILGHDYRMSIFDFEVLESKNVEFVGLNILEGG